MPDNIDLSDFDRLGHILSRVPDLAMDAAEIAMNKVLLFILGKMPDYPEMPKQGGWLKFGTPMQQAWFFWAVKMGQPQVRGWKWVGDHPEGAYIRTGSMRQITTKVTRSQEEVLGEIGIKSNYAPWVIGPTYPGRVFPLATYTKPMYQAKIHAGRWWQFEKVVNDNLTEAHALFEQEFLKEFERLSSAAISSEG